jgi:endogenous inhibitor of DNA gyrase (YacG/DUF329 family)
MPGAGPKEWPDWPFCSPRCRLIDLGRWLGESYRLPSAAGPIDPDDGDTPNSAVPSAVPHKEEA